MAADLQAMIQAHSSNLPPQLNKMVSLRKHEEIKENDWKSMQNIRVILRFRPPNRVEKQEQAKQRMKDYPPDITNNVVTLILKDSSDRHKRTHSRTSSSRKKHIAVVDHIFDRSTRQKPVFKVVGQPLIDTALGGFNATLFAYGQTGSGKTYSMFGANDDGSGTDIEAMGLIPRSFVYLFKQLEQRCSDQHIQNYAVQIQTLQIYNKQLLDLLNPNSKTKLEIKTDFTNESIFVKHLRTIPITSAREALAVLIEGSKNRIVAGHKLNAHSSRSHMLVILKIKQIRIDGSSMSSRINFGDLAGSENISKAHGKSLRGKNDEEKALHVQRRQEGISINASLSALTRCINKLVKGEHPGYRDSPLTHVLQDSLGGNSKTTLLVCASPHMYNRSETIRTLRFAATAKEVKNKAKVNQTMSVKALQKRIKELNAENAQLKSELAIAKGKMRNSGRRSRSIANTADLQMEPQLFAQYSLRPQLKANSTLNYQTQQLLRRTKDESVDDMQSVDDNDSPEDLQSLTAAVSIAEQQMVQESEEYMQQIESLNEQLQKEIQNSKELQEKNERQNLELDKSEGTIYHLRAENQDKAVKLHETQQEVEALQERMKRLEFELKDYSETFPSYKPNKYDKDASEVQRKQSQMRQNSLLDLPQTSTSLSKMDSFLEVETLEKYLTNLSSLGSAQDLNEFTEKIEANVNVLPEMRAEFTEKYEKTEVFYDNMTRKTHNLQAQISSMKFILENLASKYDEDRNKESESDEDHNGIIVMHNATGTEIHYSQLQEIKEEEDEDEDDEDDDEEESFEDELESKQSSACWTDIFYCGGNNDKAITHDEKVKRRRRLNSATPKKRKNASKQHKRKRSSRSK